MACYRAPVLRAYVTVDVFTAEPFGGNPLAVILDAQGLPASRMQSIAAEFNYSETTFILPPARAGHAAQLRIFTPRTEVPFAGHPTVGSAVVLARELEAAGGPRLEELVLEEGVGAIPVRLTREGGTVVAAEFRAPPDLTCGPPVSIEDAAACLCVGPQDIYREDAPRVLSVGLPFLVVRMASREALRRAKPSFADHARVLPPIGTDSVFAYVWHGDPQDLHARMFSPLDGIVEDPATGSAAAATLTFLAAQRPAQEAQTRWRIEQGVDMGRPSLILGRTVRRNGVAAVYVGGSAVAVMRGTLLID